MEKKETTDNVYPFFWLDSLIEETLNPEKNSPETLASAFFMGVEKQLPAELKKINSMLKSQSFCLYDNNQVKVVAGHYDQAVQFLLQQAAANLERYPKSGALRRTGQLVYDGLVSLAQNMHRRYGKILPSDSGQIKPNALFKMLFKLSGDQIAILIRAAFDSGIIDTLSKRTAFKALAPFLSTPNREDLSHDSLRSNSGRPERKDLDKVINTLDVLVKTINEYR